MRQSNNLQVIAPAAIDEKEREVPQRKPANQSASAPNDLADLRVFRYQSDNGLSVGPQLVTEAGRR